MSHPSSSDLSCNLSPASPGSINITPGGQPQKPPRNLAGEDEEEEEDEGGGEEGEEQTKGPRGGGSGPLGQFEAELPSGALLPLACVMSHSPTGLALVSLIPQASRRRTEKGVGDAPSGRGLRGQGLSPKGPPPFFVMNNWAGWRRALRTTTRRPWRGPLAAMARGQINARWLGRWRCRIRCISTPLRCNVLRVVYYLVFKLSLRILAPFGLRSFS